MSASTSIPPGGTGRWRRWLLPVLASAAWLALTFSLWCHAVQGEKAHLLELYHTRLAATAHQLMDARHWNARHGGVYVPLSEYGEPNPWLPEKDRTLTAADGRTLVLMNPAYMSRQMAERLTDAGSRLAIVGTAPLRPGNRADDWEQRMLAAATQGGQVFFSGEDCLPQGRLRLLRTLAAQESCLRCHKDSREGDMLGGISISVDAAAYRQELERRRHELGLLYGLLALTGVLAVGGITSSLTLRRERAEEKSRLKSAFMGRLSHDMRTPLAALPGIGDILASPDSGPEQRRTALGYLRRACGALLEMVDDITDHASLEQGGLRLRRHDFDLPACLRACADLYRPAAEGKELSLELQLSPELPRQVRGDSFRLRQALGNLVGNAVKFTQRGWVRIVAHGQALASGKFLLRLDVRDSGPGLAPGEEARIFESFRRGRAAGGTPGTGLGLNIARTIARQMGGDVRVAPAPGGGSIFTLEVRLEVPASGSGTAAATCGTGSGPAPGRLTGLRVLVAEDDAAGRYLLQARLQERGCSVGLACDGGRLLELLARGPWDVLLLDARMPVMDGLAVLERIRAGQSAAPRQQPVIIHSAGLGADEAERFRALGVQAFLDKPVDMALLLRVLRDVTAAAPAAPAAVPARTALPCRSVSAPSLAHGCGPSCVPSGGPSGAPSPGSRSGAGSGPGPDPSAGPASAPSSGPSCGQSVGAGESVWDRAGALAAVDGDTALLATLVTALRDDLPRMDAALAQARQCPGEGAAAARARLEALRRAAHALKNSAATLCLTELHCRAQALETAARQALEGGAGPCASPELEGLAAACASAVVRAAEALEREAGPEHEA